MRNYIIKRVLRMMPQLLLISFLAFVIIILPPGDALDIHLKRLRAAGLIVDESYEQALRHLYGLDKPWYVQYLKWMRNIIFRFEFGYSFFWDKPAVEVIVKKIPLTFTIAFGSMLFVWAVGIPIGIFTAVRQSSVLGHFFSILSYIAMGVPPFLLATVLMYTAYARFGIRIGGLFSPEYMVQGWTLAKFVDMLQHLWLPIMLVGITGLPGMIRTIRATMMDELQKQYIMVARAKGLSEPTILLRYPLRLAITPVLSSLLWLLPYLFSGGILVEIILNIPAAGPTLFVSLLTQDMYLAGTYVLVIGFLTALSSLLSDIILAAADPRIRIGDGEAT